MNNTEKELLELGRRVARNYKLIIGIGAFLYSCFIFVSTQNQHSQSILTIQNQHSHDIAKLKAEDEAIKLNARELEKRLFINEKTSSETLAVLNKVSNDVQFIKHKFIEKGMK